MTDDMNRLGEGLTTARLGQVHEHHAEIGSTNDRAAAWARDGAPDGALVTADRQASGRGRRGRVWSSPDGGDIYASLVLRPGVAAPQLGALGLAVAVGLHEGLAALGVPTRIKWPNDLLVVGRKIAGILCETRWVGQQAEVVVGFGVNVARTEFPDALSHATSVAAVVGAEHPGRVRVLQSILAALEDALDAFFSGGFGAIRARYEPHCVVLGQTLILPAEGPHPARRVKALRLDVDGALVVADEGGGSPFRVESADVWLAPG